MLLNCTVCICIRPNSIQSKRYGLSLQSLLRTLRVQLEYIGELTNQNTPIWVWSSACWLLDHHLGDVICDLIDFLLFSFDLNYLLQYQWQARWYGLLTVARIENTACE